MRNNTVGYNISKTVIHTYSVNNTGQFALSYSRVTMGFAPAELRPESGLAFTFIFVYLECESCCL